MNDGQIELLRGWVRTNRNADRSGHFAGIVDAVTDATEAAIAEIEQLRDEIEKLRGLQFAVGQCKASDVPEAVYRAWKDSNGYRMSELKRQADEIERLRAALQAIVHHQESIGGGLAVLSTTRKIAQEALTAADAAGGER